LLDQLLTAHTDQLLANEDRDSTLVLDIEVARIHARALCARIGIEAPIVDCSIKHLTTRFTKNSNAERPVTDLALWTKRIDILLCAPSPGMRLQNVESAGSSGAAVGRVLSEGVQIGLNTRTRHTRFLVRLNTLDTSVVTPAFDNIRDLVRIWQDASASLPTPSDKPEPVAVVIYNAVRAAVNEDQTLSQPAFAYESSYGLHVDDYRDIRRDLGWTMLTRIRHWLNALPEPVTKATADIASYTIAELSKIEDWASGSDSFIRQQAFLKIAFGSDIHSDQSHRIPILDRTTHVFANVDIFKLEHSGKMLESDLIVSSSLSIVSASTGLQYTLAHKGSRPIKRVRAVNTVKAIEVVLQNSIFHAVQPLLTLMPTAQATDIPKPDTDNVSQSIVLLDNQVERAELEVIAAGLRMRAVLDRGSMNVFHKSGAGFHDQRAEIASNTKATTMIHNIETTLSVGQDRAQSASSMPAGVVATWGSKDFGGLISFACHGGSRDPDQLKILLSLKHFSLNIQPQMKALHDLIYHVRQEDVP